MVDVEPRRGAAAARTRRVRPGKPTARFPGRRSGQGALWRRHPAGACGRTAVRAPCRGAHRQSRVRNALFHYLFAIFTYALRGTDILSRRRRAGDGAIRVLERTAHRLVRNAGVLVNLAFGAEAVRAVES